MRILFVHPFFPGHYPHVATALAADPGHRVVFLTRAAEGELPGVEKHLYAPRREPGPSQHPYLGPVEAAVLSGQAACRAALALKREGFEPDVVCFHAGYGPALYLAEVFPKARRLGYFEWYYHAHGGDADFLEPGGLDIDRACAVHTRNAPVLLDYASSDARICPTAFQRDRFPKVLRAGLTTLHDGIDTDFFCPGEAGEVPGLDLSGADGVVTYATRGMEPYRGFPQFLRAAALLLRRRPRLRVVVAGGDGVWYGRRRPDGRTHKEALLEEMPDLDPERLIFVGSLPYPQYRALLRASSVHVYLTVPFVLSWSLLEAMACGCRIVASDTEPVREMIEDGRQGLLTDFFDVEALAARIGTALDGGPAIEALGRAARKRILDRYALSRLLPRHLELIRAVAAG